MRYTLRLLTLDQLSRAATLICALELERQKDVEKLGEWPFEIGLWVGKAATPNRMGAKGDGDSRTRPGPRPSPSRTTTASRRRSRWKSARGAATKFKANSFQLVPNPDQPTDLRVACVNRRLRLQPRPAAADPGRGRADLPPAAVLPDRHRGQVRRHAVDRRGGRVLRPGATATTRTASTVPAIRRRASRCLADACCRPTW